MSIKVKQTSLWSVRPWLETMDHEAPWGPMEMSQKMEAKRGNYGGTDDRIPPSFQPSSIDLILRILAFT